MTDVLTFELIQKMVKQCQKIMEENPPPPVAYFHPETYAEDFGMTLGQAKDEGILPEWIKLSVALPNDNKGYIVPEPIQPMKLEIPEPKYRFNMAYTVKT